MRLVVVAICLTCVGCGSQAVSGFADTMCSRVDRAATITAEALRASDTYRVPETYVNKYLFPVAKLVEEAFELCFDTSEDEQR